MERLDLFTNLVALAGSDGKFTQQEVEYLAIKAEQWGLDPEDVDSILIGMQEQSVEVTVPEDRQERVELLSEMIQMMAIDGDLADTEKRFCAEVSAAMEFTAREFNEILDQLVGRG